MPPALGESQALEALRRIVGPAGVVDSEFERAPFLEEARGLHRGQAALILKPQDTDEVAQCLRVCHEAGLPVSPQGGNTGLVGGALPRDGARAVLLSLQRMNRIRRIDPHNFSLTAEAGCILAQVQEAAAEAGRLFPLSMASEGSCSIGGALATNAGGLAVLRYGTMRDLALGLEVVLPDGRVWSRLGGLRKDTAGYDLKHLFIGAEGTLGVITAAVLKLYPRPHAFHTALAAVPDATAAVSLLSRLRDRTGDATTAFEYVPRIAFDYVLSHIDGVTDPMEAPSPAYVLMELSDVGGNGDSGNGEGDGDGDGDSALMHSLETVLEQALEAGEVTDAVLARSEAQRQALWRLRESIPRSQSFEGASIKHDVSIPPARLPDFLREAETAVRALEPDLRVVAFGHIGDGNVHYNLSRPVGGDDTAFLARWDAFNAIVHDVVTRLGGSISAEHGIGLMKRDILPDHVGPVAIDVMQAVKRALDPRNIMNPGKVLQIPES